ncbi:MAG TPA: hypothetical protein VMZ29_03585 [Candidatus Bathyarchaeia archaeon]|nr:hypothetical protein [Candidatus Bathyarchaeia archaeon]
MSYTIRDFKPEDLPRQIDIMKQVTRELYPIVPYDLDKHTVEGYRRLYSRPGWHPVPLKMLIDSKGEIVGYSGYGNYFNDLRLFFPYIIGEHRTDELMQRLFDETMKAVREIQPNFTTSRIFARSDTNLTQHNKFMSKQSFEERKEGFLIKIETNKLEQKISFRFKIKFFEREDIERVAEFSKLIATYQKPYFTNEDLIERIELGNIKPKTHIIIEEENEILAIIGLRIAQLPNQDGNVAVLNLELIDQDREDLELRKTLYTALFPIFKEYQVKNFSFEILEDSKSRFACEELGFEYVEGIGGIYYYFK